MITTILITLLVHNLHNEWDYRFLLAFFFYLIAKTVVTFVVCWPVEETFYSVHE